MTQRDRGIDGKKETCRGGAVEKGKDGREGGRVGYSKRQIEGVK